jgi:hypothetical protein
VCRLGHVRIANSDINDHSDVANLRIGHSWARAEALDLNDFRT